jgi:hypothetical protein
MDPYRDDYYEILGVSRNATSEAIRENYIKLSKKNHPDQGGTGRIMQMINEAYDVLGDNAKRAEYNQWLLTGQTSGPRAEPASSWESAGNAENNTDSTAGFSHEGILEIKTLDQSVAMPLICACCMKDYDKAVKLPYEAKTKNDKTIIFSKIKVPLCRDCLKHIRKYQRIASLISLAAAILAVSLQSAITHAFRINPFLAALPAILLVLLPVYFFFVNKPPVINAAHAGKDYPINLFIDASSSMKFTFYNPNYGQIFLARNPNAFIHQNIVSKTKISRFLRSKRFKLYVTNAFYCAFLFCLVTGVILNGLHPQTSPKTSTTSSTIKASTLISQTTTIPDLSPWTGEWMTTFGYLVFEKASGSNNGLEGTYLDKDGTLTGEVSGTDFAGTFQEGATTGSFTFTISNAGKIFTGSRYVDNQAKRIWEGEKTSSNATSSSSQAAVTTTTETAYPYETKAKPDTGLIKSYSSGSKTAPFTVKTAEDGADYFVKLVNKSTSNIVYTFYIHNGETLSTKIAVGTYILKYASGTSWYGTEQLFGPDTSYFEGSGELKFYKSGSTVYGFTITLYKVAGGNFDTTEIDPEDF